MCVKMWEWRIPRRGNLTHSRSLTQKQLCPPPLFFRTAVHIFTLYPLQMMDDVSETLLLAADHHLQRERAEALRCIFSPPVGNIKRKEAQHVVRIPTNRKFTVLIARLNKYRAELLWAGLSRRDGSVHTTLMFQHKGDENNLKFNNFFSCS